MYEQQYDEEKKNDLWKLPAALALLPALIPAGALHLAGRKYIHSRKILWLCRGIGLILCILVYSQVVPAFKEWLALELQYILYFIGHYAGFGGYIKPESLKPLINFALTGTPFVYLGFEFWPNQPERDILGDRREIEEALTRMDEEEEQTRQKEDISKTEHPEDGTLIAPGEVITNREANAHILVAGATGAGKTTTLANFVEYCCQSLLSCCIIDGKGDAGLLSLCRRLAGKFGRPFYMFSLTYPEDSCHYNPLRHGGATELKDKIIGTSDWTEPHYKLSAERYLQNAFHILLNTGSSIDLINASKNLREDKLISLARGGNEEAVRAALAIESLTGEEIEAYQGIFSRLMVFAEADKELRNLLTDTGDSRTLDIRDAMDEGAIILFSLSSSKYSQYAPMIARLVIQDIKTVVAERERRRLGEEDNTGKVYAIFDEFSDYANSEFYNILRQARSASFHVILALQEIATLPPQDAKQVLANTNTKIIHSQRNPDSAELFATTIGTKLTTVWTEQVNADSETGKRELTGGGTVKKDRSFIVHPDKIKQLDTGEAYLLRSNPHRVSKVNIRMVDI